MNQKHITSVPTRYARQVRFSGIGELGQSKLNNSRVAIVGLGALGTVLADQLVRAGVGYIRLIDRDYVEVSNLQRQMLYDEHDAMEIAPKAIAAAAKLKAANSQIQIDTHVVDLNPLNAERLLSDVQLILDGSDNFAVRYLINDVALKLGIPWIYGAAVASRGVSFTVLPGQTPCLRCLFPDPPAAGIAETCDTAGIIAPASNTIASHQMAEALKLLIGETKLLNPKMCHFDLWHNHTYAVDVTNAKKPSCPACGKQQYEFLDAFIQENTIQSLCGRNAVQIHLQSKTTLTLEQWEKKLKPIGETLLNRFLLKFKPTSEIEFIIFSDGRVIIQGVSDLDTAKTLYARYLGM